MFKYQVVTERDGRPICLSRHHTEAAAQERMRQLTEGLRKRYPYYRPAYRVSLIEDEPLPPRYHIGVR